MIHEGPSRVAHEERSGEAEVGAARRGSLSAFTAPITRSVFGTRVFLGSYHDGSIHSPGGQPRRTARGRKKYCAVNGLTCPCCSAAPPLLDCSPWTDSCCCIHSSVSLQKRRETEDEDSLLYFASDRSAKFLVGNNVGAPPSSFSAVQNVNAIQRDVVYILRNAYEIVLYG